MAEVTLQGGERYGVGDEKISAKCLTRSRDLTPPPPLPTIVGQCQIEELQTAHERLLRKDVIAAHQPPRSTPHLAPYVPHLFGQRECCPPPCCKLRVLSHRQSPIK